MKSLQCTSFHTKDWDWNQTNPQRWYMESFIFVFWCSNFYVHWNFGVLVINIKHFGIVGFACMVFLLVFGI